MPSPVKRSELNAAITAAARSRGLEPQPFLDATAGHKLIARGTFDTGSRKNLPPEHRRCLCPISCRLVKEVFAGLLPSAGELEFEVENVQHAEMMSFASAFDSETSELVRRRTLDTRLSDDTAYTILEVVEEDV